MRDDAYLDDFGVVKGGLFDLELGTSHCLVTEEWAHRLFGCVLVPLNTLLDLSDFSNLCNGGGCLLA
jgi:hypothetical protein